MDQMTHDTNLHASYQDQILMSTAHQRAWSPTTHLGGNITPTPHDQLTPSTPPPAAPPSNNHHHISCSSAPLPTYLSIASSQMISSEGGGASLFHHSEAPPLGSHILPHATPTSTLGTPTSPYSHISSSTSPYSHITYSQASLNGPLSYSSQIFAQHSH